MFYENGKIKELSELLSSFKDSTNAEFSWRLARVGYELAKLSSLDDEKKRLTYEAFERAKLALQQDSNNSACHKVREFESEFECNELTLPVTAFN